MISDHKYCIYCFCLGNFVRLSQQVASFLVSRHFIYNSTTVFDIYDIVILIGRTEACNTRVMNRERKTLPMMNLDQQVKVHSSYVIAQRYNQNH